MALRPMFGRILSLTCPRVVSMIDMPVEEERYSVLSASVNSHLGVAPEQVWLHMAFPRFVS